MLCTDVCFLLNFVRKGKEMHIRKRTLFILFFILLAALALSACQGGPTPTPAIVVVTATALPPTPTPLPTPLPDQSEIVAAWQGSPHGNTYDEGKGPNTWCSRCHSPQNWDPESFIGPPPSCFSCKMPTDKEIRIAAGNPVRSAVSHKITLGGPAHLNYAGFIDEVKPPTYCTDCHDPHTQQPKQCVDCHEIDPAAHAGGKYALMADKLTCMACHDSSGAEVGPNPDEAAGGVWTTLLTEQGRSGPTTSAIVSHSIQYTVACNRCHFDGNTLGLTVYNETGEIPEPTPTATVKP